MFCSASNGFSRWCIVLLSTICFVTITKGEEPLKVDSDTLALWNFDQANGQNIPGEVKGNAGTLSGGASLVDGKFGKAIQFDGLNGKLAVNNGKLIHIRGDQGCAIEAWVQIHKHGQTQPIVSGPPFFELEIRGDSGALSFNIASSDGKTSLRCTGKKSVADGAWHHVAGVRDPKTRKVAVYVDGQLDTEVEDTTAGQELLVAESVLVGSNSTGSETLGGLIDELRLSSIARSFSANAAGRTAEAAKSYVLENDRVKFTFDLNGSKLSLGGLLDKKQGVEFIATGVPGDNLWQASMRSAGGSAIISELSAPLAVDQRTTQDGQEIDFVWKRLPIAEEAGVADLKVTVSLANDSALADWRINLDNRSKKYGLWTARFPRITNLAKLSDDGKDVIAIPGGNGGGAGEGQVYPDPFKTLNHAFLRTYPCYLQAMQFNTYYNDKAGLYLASHDGKMNLKGFLIQPQSGTKPVVLYEVHHYPADSGVAGTGLKQDYPHYIGTFTGDWYDACQIYRKWAIKQVWCSAGTLENRKDISPFIRNGAYWMVGTFEWQPSDKPLLRDKIRRMSADEHRKSVRQLDVEKSLAMVKEASDFFGFPLLLWTNEWFDGGGDISPPRYMPQGGLDQYMKRIHSDFKNVYVTGHMQMKRYSVQLAEYDATVEKSIEFLPNGEKAIESIDAMDKGEQIAYPCWATQFWFDFWNAKAKSIVKSTDLNGFHVDELASASGFEFQCFNPNHGHPIGGGTMYADTRRKMITMLRDSARTVRPDFAIHHEALSEIYLDRVDLAEVDTTPSNKNAPLWEAVYHDYSFVMGRRIHPWMDRRLFQVGDLKFGDNAIDEFVSSFAQTYIWGNQPGWTRLDIVQYSPKVADVIKRFMQVRYRNMKFLNVGQSIRALKLKTPQEMVKVIWTTCDTPEHTLPTIMNSVWKSSDGSIGIVLANITDSPRKIHYGYDLSEEGGTHGKWKLRRTDGSTPVEIGEVVGDTLDRTDEVPPRSVIVIEAVPQK